ncbi:MAG: hypothetical protein D6772_03185 [Bacteroidetes bacterium]|nr:MAG: hypothetical protein D6772_03185 [Bacteroidota bacterium]
MVQIAQAKFCASQEKLITQIQTLKQLLDNGYSLRNCTLQSLDLRPLKINWDSFHIENTLFLGCQLEAEEELSLRRKGAFIYHAPDKLPYDPFRTSLYSWQELLSPTHDGRSRDLAIYEHFSQSRFKPSINEALWQRLHDHAIDDALRRLLEYNAEGMTEKRCVAIMGGHSVRRDHPDFARVVHTAKLLGEAGYFVASGGGPGIMEAANLGAYLAGQPEQAVSHSLALLAKAPHYSDEAYQKVAQEVLEHYSDGQKNLAIPTWFYGHEPSNLFASHIAKYFSNSIREDTLLAVALYGIVFAPGSAGTTQEIFMDAAQNHYATFNYYSPMVFLGRKRYEIDTMIYPLIRQLSYGMAYHDLLHLTDEPEEVVNWLRRHEPVMKEGV